MTLFLSLSNEGVSAFFGSQRLTFMDVDISALEQRRDKTIAIKQGMIQQLLTGKVRLSESRICTDDTDDTD